MPIKKGMRFDDVHELAKIIGYTKSNNRVYIKKALAHYCTFHEEDKVVVIDDVFDEPIPFIINNFQYEIGDVLENEFSKFEVIGRTLEVQYESIGHKTRLYHFKCLKDGNRFSLNANQIKKGAGCNLCGRKRIRKGKSLYEVRPDLLVYLANPEDAKNYAPSASRLIKCKCPNCGTPRELTVNRLYMHGFSCPSCSDGVSYPNKFMQNFLNMLKIEHTRECAFDWSEGKIYDQYAPLFNLIIECHGAQHYKDDKGQQFPNMGLAGQQANDKYKRELAKANGIKNYIELDCSLSTLEFMRNSIMNSELPCLLNFAEADVDWEKCDEISRKSTEWFAWELWNAGHGLTYICIELGIADVSARTYIQNGIRLNKCEKRKDMQDKGECFTLGQYYPVYCEEDDEYFSSRLVIEEVYPDRFPPTGSISLGAFIRRGKTYKGKTYRFIEQSEYNRVFYESKRNDSLKVYGKPFDLEGKYR